MRTVCTDVWILYSITASEETEEDVLRERQINNFLYYSHTACQHIIRSLCCVRVDAQAQLIQLPFSRMRQAGTGRLGMRKRCTTGYVRRGTGGDDNPIWQISLKPPCSSRRPLERIPCPFLLYCSCTISAKLRTFFLLEEDRNTPRQALGRIRTWPTAPYP